MQAEAIRNETAHGDTPLRCPPSPTPAPLDATGVGQLIPSVISTYRLHLRPLCAEDAPALLHQCMSHPEVSRHLEWEPHTEMAHTRTYIEQCEEKSRLHGERHWAIRLHTGSDPIGLLSCQVFTEVRTAVIGYLLAPRHWRQGYTSEACKALIAHVRPLSGVDHIASLIEATNLSSMRVVWGLGMVRHPTAQESVVCPALSAAPRVAHWYVG